MKRILKSEEHMYILEEDERGALYFEVLCGGVGMYMVRIELNAEECASYAEEGEDFLNELAYKIGKNTRAYKDRAIR